MSAVGAIVAAMSWTDVFEAVGSLLSRHAKTVIGAAFAVLMVFVPPARAVVVKAAEWAVRDNSVRVTRDLTPAITPLFAPPTTRG